LQKEQRPFDQGCPYCNNNQKIMSSLIKIAPLQVSTLYLLKEQTYKGRSVVVLNWHVKEMFELSKEELTLFAADLARAAQALNKAVRPQKINYAIYGDLVSHLHCHLAPKFDGKEDWGGPFHMNPDNKVYLQEEEYNAILQAIKMNLN
jgi:ATP adenylyltransferase